MSATAGPSGSHSEPSASTNVVDKAADRLKRLRDLHMRRNEARKLNHQEVVEEDRRAKQPSNHQARQERAQYLLDKEEKKKQATERGDDFDRLRLLDVKADDAERNDRKKQKKNPDVGFSDYEQATFRQYNRNVKQMKPSMSEYEKEKTALGDEAFYPTTGTIIQGLHKDSKEAVDRMAEDVEKQISKRDKYSRRRKHNDDDDIDYINERNMRFNKKLERFYGQYTSEIKQNLERGTAV